MAQQNQFPRISAETRERLRSQGFENAKYSSYKLPSFLIPRGAGFDIITYGVMALGVAGAIVGRKHNCVINSCVFAVAAAPVLAFIQKKQADSFHSSSLSRMNPAILIQDYPVLKQSFKVVSNEVDEQIAKIKERVRQLQIESTGNNQA